MSFSSELHLKSASGGQCRLYLNTFILFYQLLSLLKYFVLFAEFSVLVLVDRSAVT